MEVVSWTRVVVTGLAVSVTITGVSEADGLCGVMEVQALGVSRVVALKALSKRTRGFIL